MKFYSLLFAFIVVLNSAYCEESTGRVTFDSKEAAKIIARSHLHKPDFEEVLKNTQTPSSTRQYLSSLDKYSSYRSPQEVVFRKERSQPRRQGLGMVYLSSQQGLLGVPVDGGPAYKNGMREPLFITSVNGKKMSVDDFSTYSFLTNFKAGQKVELVGVDRVNNTRLRYRVTVGLVFERSFRLSTRNDFDYIRIYKFNETLLLPLKQYLTRSRKKVPLVVDLRFSPGGDVFAMVDLLSFFMDKETVVAQLSAGRFGKPIPLKTLDGRIIENNRNIVIVISAFTASSAELFARAIRHYLPNVKVIGEATKGKCYAQEYYPLKKGGGLVLTRFRVLDASGVDCESRPMLPDLYLDNSALRSMDEIGRSLTAEQHSLIK